VGPKWWFKGDPIVLGPIMMQQKQDDDTDDDGHASMSEQSSSYWPIPHYWPFTEQDGIQLWEHTMNVLNIDEFGKYND
jgi:hypothetical protein